MEVAPLLRDRFAVHAMVTLIALCVASSTHVAAQTNDGYVGVFGDAAGTIQCMAAPPFVPTTLYVVAKTSGATANGITGAEFRIEFSNPIGYYLNYTAPNGSLALGDPLSTTGFNLSFSTCQTPVDGIVLLGTISVFNAGSGGQSDLIVKRRNPPTNQSYECALLVQCDDPVFTKTCNTAPPDSSCLAQKNRSGPTLEADEYSTELDGSAVPTKYRYLGYTHSTAEVANCSSFEGASAIITVQYGLVPAGGLHSAVWVGLGNRSSPYAETDVNARWIQAGFIGRSVGLPKAYFEWCGHSTTIVDGSPDGWSGIVVLFDVFPGNQITFQVYKDGNSGRAVAGPIDDPVVPWAELLEAGNLEVAAWTGEVANDDIDRMPGTANAKCEFDEVQYRSDASSQLITPFLSSSPLDETTRGAKHKGIGLFEIWRLPE